MKKMLIDTNVYTAFKRGNKDVIELLAFAEEIYLCPTVLGELLSGFKAGGKCKTNTRELEQFIDSPRVHLLDTNMETAEYYSVVYLALRKKGNPIPTNDMWIAASALQRGVAICTLDRHFSNIDGLIVETP